MRSTDDLWYIRLPNGKVVRAKTTRALRHHLQSGRVPWASWVRRSSTDDWTTLDWVPEVADLQKEVAKRKTEASRPEARNGEPIEEATPERSLGVRGLIDELLNALEGALNQTQLLCGAGMGFALGLGMVGASLLYHFVSAPLAHALVVGWWTLMLAFGVVGSVLLTRMRVLEIARLRPARSSEVRQGFLGRSLRLFLAFLLTGGVVLGLLLALPFLHDNLRSNGERTLPEVLLAVLAASRLILEVSCWPILILTFLLAPILVVEEVGVFGTIRHWLRVLRIHMGRLLIYEALTLVVAIVTTLPFLAPIAFAWYTEPEAGLPGLVRENLLLLFTGLALTPFLTYLTVANVNIYLNVQYELYQSQRILAKS